MLNRFSYARYLITSNFPVRLSGCGCRVPSIPRHSTIPLTASEPPPSIHQYISSIDQGMHRHNAQRNAGSRYVPAALPPLHSLLFQLPRLHISFAPAFTLNPLPLSLPHFSRSTYSLSFLLPRPTYPHLCRQSGLLDGLRAVALVRLDGRVVDELGIRVGRVDDLAVARVSGLSVFLSFPHSCHRRSSNRACSCSSTARPKVGERQVLTHTRCT